MDEWRRFRHVMRLVHQWPTGAQSYMCPVCARMVMVEWGYSRNSFRVIVMDHGNTSVPHTIARTHRVNAEADPPETTSRPTDNMVDEDTGALRSWQDPDIDALLSGLDDAPPDPV